MKKFLIAVVVFAMIGITAQSCTDDSQAEQEKLYTDSPDADEYKRPGGGS